MKSLDKLQNKQIGLPENLREVDENLEKLIRPVKTKTLERYFTVFSLAGKEPTTFGMSMLTAGILLRRKQYLEGLSVLLAVGGGWLINQVLKRTVKRPRPPSLNVLRNHAKTYSFPSAHTNLSVCYYGMLAWLGLKFFKNPAGRISWLLLMLFLMLMIGTSRVYRKEHHPTDVLAGYLIGSIWLLILIVSTSRYERKQK